jgi:hypothetical protein
MLLLLHRVWRVICCKAAAYGPDCTTAATHGNAVGCAAAAAGCLHCPRLGGKAASRGRGGPFVASINTKIWLALSKLRSGSL